MIVTELAEPAASSAPAEAAPAAAPASQPAPTRPTRPSWALPRRRGRYLDGATSAGSRLLGIDAARGLAILGMMVAHVGVTSNGLDSIQGWLAFAHGRSSILFAVIAGFSLGLLSGGVRPHQGEKLVRTRLRILVRSALLLVIAAGLQLLGTSVAIIIGFYAAWFALALPVLHWGARRLLILAAATAVIGGLATEYLPWLLTSLGLDPMNAYGANAALVEFMLTGTYPGVVWMAFVFAGLGLSRIPWDRAGKLAALLAVGVALAVTGHVGSYLLTGWLAPELQAHWTLTNDAGQDGEFRITDEELPKIEQDIVDGWLSPEDAADLLTPEQLAEVKDGTINGVTLSPLPGSPNAPDTAASDDGDLSGSAPADGDPAGSTPAKLPDETSALDAAAVAGPTDSLSWDSGTDSMGGDGYFSPTGPGWHSVPAPPINQMLNVAAHSGTPFEAIGNGGVAIAIIAALGLIARRAAWILAPLITVGAMSLTVYCGHIIGIWAVDPFGGGMGASGNGYLAGMAGIAIAVAMAWRFFFARGPLEHLVHVISVRATLPPAKEGELS